MGRIDELPLDIFGEAEEERDATPPDDPPAPVDTVDAEPAQAGLLSVREMTFLSILLVAAVMGLAMRIVQLAVLTPVLNAVLAYLVVTRIEGPHHEWMLREMAWLQGRLSNAVDKHRGERLPANVEPYKVLYDAGMVAALALAAMTVFWMAGIDRLMPDGTGWTLGVAAAIVGYLTMSSRLDRDALRVWMYHRLRAPA